MIVTANTIRPTRLQTVLSQRGSGAPLKFFDLAPTNSLHIGTGENRGLRAGQRGVPEANNTGGGRRERSVPRGMVCREDDVLRHRKPDNSTAFTRLMREETRKLEREQRRKERVEKRAAERASGVKDDLYAKGRQTGKKTRRNLKAMDYQEYLMTPHWREVRQAMLKHQPECETCGSDRGLHVHHLTYERRGNERKADLQVLCSGCHRNRHEGEIVGVYDPMTREYMELVASF